MRSGKMASFSPRGCPPVLPHFHPLLFVACYQCIAAAPYCRPNGTRFLSAGQPSYPHRTLSALLSALPWLSDHGVGWCPHYWDHKIEHGTYGTARTASARTALMLWCVCRMRRAGVVPPACLLFVYSDHYPLFVRPLVLHFATTPSRSLSLPPDTFKSVPPAKNQKAKLLCLDRHANMPATRTRISSH